MKSQINFNSSISILFVEDDATILELLTSMLVARFPDVVFYTAGNGRLGLELFNAHRPDIVITDINMPEMCGFQMSDNIRAVKPDTKIIAITGRSGDAGKNGIIILQHSEEKIIEFDHVIVKPVALSELFAVIEQCIDQIKQHKL